MAAAFGADIAGWPPGIMCAHGSRFLGLCGGLAREYCWRFFAGAHRAHCFFWAGNVDIDTFYVIRPIGDGAQPRKEGHAATQLPCYVIEGVYVIICAGLCGGTMP